MLDAGLSLPFGLPRKPHARTPIRAQHLTFDLDLVHARSTTLTLSAYQRLYLDYPVASAYPQLAWATIADTFGQLFLMH